MGESKFLKMEISLLKLALLPSQSHYTANFDKNYCCPKPQLGGEHISGDGIPENSQFNLKHCAAIAVYSLAQYIGI